MSKQSLHTSRMNIDGAANITTGIPDANKVVKTNSSGKIDTSFLSGQVGAYQSIEFAYKDIIAPSASEEVYLNGWTIARKLVPHSGQIVAVTVQTETTVTAGTITAKPTVNGVPLVATGLNTILSANDSYSTVAWETSGYSFNAGDKLGVVLETDALWDALSRDISISLTIQTS